MYHHIYKTCVHFPVSTFSYALACVRTGLRIKVIQQTDRPRFRSRDFSEQNLQKIIIHQSLNRSPEELWYYQSVLEIALAV